MVIRIKKRTQIKMALFYRLDNETFQGCFGTTATCNWTGIFHHKPSGHVFEVFMSSGRVAAMQERQKGVEVSYAIEDVLHIIGATMELKNPRAVAADFENVACHERAKWSYEMHIRKTAANAITSSLPAYEIPKETFPVLVKQ